MTTVLDRHMAPICPDFTPHPEWTHLCNCETCTARARQVDVQWPLDFDDLYVRSAVFRYFVHYDEQPRLDPLHGWPVRLTWDAQPPPDKFDLLATIEPRFDRSYRRRRPDLRDQTDSSYDLSLATFAFATEWTCQEVADLLIAGRREHGDPDGAQKALRRDYMERTLLRALLSVARRADA